MPNRWTTGKLRDVRERVARGETNAEIGKHYGITGSGIGHILRRQGITRTPRDPAYKIPKENDIAERRARGETLRSISAVYELHEATVRRYCILHNIKPQRSIETLRQLRSQGLTIKEIAKMWKTRPSVVRRWEMRDA